ncbi:rhodanese-like domain-containing protein [Azospirillum sp. ST 5-10]|uniref:rhodanese-like domain-containing protein n=1 Tax=unclassified Azospirillum TaxID=2630922 RepID=UPI003F4A387F
MPTSVKQMLEAANAAVPRISPDEARALMADDNALAVDVRDGTEVAKTGKLKGAINVSRGMIEFRADADTPYHDAEFQKERPIILYCASGGRSALAGQALKDMGYERVYNLGGFQDAAAAGLETEPA